MIKPRPVSTSIRPHSQDIQDFLVRGHKYLRVVKQFDEFDDMPKIIIPRLLKKIKGAKKLQKLGLDITPQSNFHLKSEAIHSLLKVQAKKQTSLSLSVIPQKFSKSQSFVSEMKNLRELSICNRTTEIKHLKALRKLERLTVDFINNDLKISSLYAILSRMKNLKSLKLEVSPASIGNMIELLNELVTKFSSSIKIQIVTNKDQEYEHIPTLEDSLLQSLTHLSLQSISSSPVLFGLFVRPKMIFPDLKVLKLEFTDPCPLLATYLGYLKDIPMLEKLRLDFTECWCEDFSKAVINKLQLPASLKNLKINMPLALQSLILRNKEYFRANQGKERILSVRNHNIFEDEPGFISFFEAIANAKGLKKIKLDFEMLETFDVHYTNFFISVLKRLPDLISFAFHVTGYQKPEKDSEGFDLALLLHSCSQLRHLERIEAYMPNFVFDDVKLATDLKRLKEFNIGLMEDEEQESIRFDNISNHIRNLLKALSHNSQNLTSLSFDFVEVIDERSLLSRFGMIKKFKNLESFCGRFDVKKVSQYAIMNMGQVLKSLRKLETLVLEFFETDGKFTEIKPYLKSPKCIRNLLVSFNKITWIGGCWDGFKNNSSKMETETNQIFDDKDLLSSFELDCNNFSM